MYIYIYSFIYVYPWKFTWFTWKSAPRKGDHFLGFHVSSWECTYDILLIFENNELANDRVDLLPPFWGGNFILLTCLQWGLTGWRFRSIRQSGTPFDSSKNEGNLCTRNSSQKKNSSSCFQLFPQKTSSNEYIYVKKKTQFGAKFGGLKLWAPMSKTLPILGVVLGQILSQSFPGSPNPSPTNISTK